MLQLYCSFFVYYERQLVSSSRLSVIIQVDKIETLKSNENNQ